MVKLLIDDMAAQIDNAGEIAIITTSFTATNQVNWIKVMEDKIASDYPEIKIITTEAVGERYTWRHMKRLRH